MLHSLAQIALIESGLMLLPAAVALYYKETETVKVFLIVAACIAAAQIPILLLTRRRETDNMNFRDGVAIAACGWIVISFFGALP